MNTGYSQNIYFSKAAAGILGVTDLENYLRVKYRKGLNPVEVKNKIFAKDLKKIDISFYKKQ